MPETPPTPTPARRCDPADVCALGPADAEAVGALVTGRRFTQAVLAAELSDADRYVWFGARDRRGDLVAAHRALWWGDYLFLKGVFVDVRERGGAAALRLALGLRDLARREGSRGIAAWVSDASPAQRALAARLRLDRTGAPLHLFAVAVPPCGGESADGEAGGAVSPGRRSHREISDGPVEEILARRNAAVGGDALVPGLLLAPGSPPVPRRSPARHSLPDRDRLLLGGLPCRTFADVPTLLEEVSPRAAATGLRAIEVPVPAAALPLVLWLTGRKATRLSAGPVFVGRLDFPPC